VIKKTPVRSPKEADDKLQKTLGFLGAVALMAMAQLAKPDAAKIAFTIAAVSCVGAATVLSFLKGGWGDLARSRWKRPFVLSVCAAVLGTVAGVYYWLAPQSEFSIVSSTMMRHSEPGVSVFVKPTGSTEGNLPIIAENLDLLAFVEIANLVNEQKYFSGYSVEMKTGLVSWERLCNIDLTDGKVGVIDDKAALLRMAKLSNLDEQLKGGIPPNGSAAGWTVWSCPESGCSKEFRFVLQDKQGHRTTLPLTEGGSDLSQLNSKAMFSVPKKEEIPLQRLVVASRRNCARKQVD